MFTEILTFEIKYQFRKPLFYIVTVAFFLMAFLAASTDTVQIGGAIGNVHRNAPIVIVRILTVMSAVGLLVVTAFVASAAQRDFELGTHELFFSKPITKLDYLLGRFVGASAVSLLVFLGAAAGIAAGSSMPWLDPAQLGPFMLAPYVLSLLVFVLPNLLFIGATFFALASWSRSMLLTYLGVVAFFVVYAISGVLISNLENELVAGLLDPFGVVPLQIATKYWTIVERNSALPEVAGIVFYNRLVWTAAGALLLGLVCSRFRPSWRPRRRKTKSVSETVEQEESLATSRVSPLARFATSFGPRTMWRQLRQRTWFETVSIVKSVPFAVILAFAMFNLIANASFVDRQTGAEVYPVTYLMVEAMEGSFLFLLTIVLAFYGGLLVWRERDVGLAEVADSMPVPDWVFVGAKLAALMAVIGIFTAIGIVTTIAMQLQSGYTQFELGLYARGAFLACLPFGFIAVLAVFVQVMANNKFVGYLLVVLYLLGQIMLPRIGFQHNLYLYGSPGGVIYSDMNGYGHYLVRFFWFSLYWSFVALLLWVLSNTFWVRGTETSWKTRLGVARSRFTRPWRVLTAVGLIGVLAVGGYILYNTNVLNEYLPRREAEERQAEYEKRYSQYRDLSLPRIAAVQADVAIFPHQRRLEIRGNYRMVNETSEPIPALHLSIPPSVRINKIKLRDHRVQLADEVLGYYIYDLAEPLAPGESMDLGFDLVLENKGFRNHASNTAVVYNGTFFNNRRYFPQGGYNELLQLRGRNLRRKHGLTPDLHMAAVDDLFARRDTYLGRDSDWIDFETTVSTHRDQIAIAPGYLQKEWTEGDRRYFHYVMDSPMLNFFSYLSARYQVLRGRFEGIEIEIYHHPGHAYNVDRMLDAVKKSLRYYSTHFSPYQYRQVRIIEFPRYTRLAVSFPNTIPFSEASGFLHRGVSNGIDYPFYYTAHEVAHQWWGHQVIGGNVQGATMLSETLAQYSALMVMEGEYGRDRMRRFLRHELDRYLRGRGGELVEELPLYRVERDQSYIHYHKGSLAMYALRDHLGEDVLNRVVSRYLRSVAFQDAPFTSSREFLDLLRAEMPAELQYLIEDMFETITLFENRVTAATSRRLEDGRYLVKLEVDTRKLRADGHGAETEIPIDDWIDIGVFGTAEKAGADGKVLALEKRHVDETASTFELVVSEQPLRAGVDPYYKLVDRNPADNVRRVQTVLD